MSEAGSLRDLRRGQIIAEARALVAAEGLEGMTIGALERRLPFSRGVITHHFDSKHEIVDAVLQSAIDEIDAATQADVAASATMEEKVHAVVGSTVRGFLQHVEASRILVSFWGRLAVDAQVAERNASLYRRYRRQSASLVREGQERGVFSPGADPETISTLIVGIVIGIATQVLFDPPAIDVRRAIDEGSRMVLATLSTR